MFIHVQFTKCPGLDHLLFNHGIPNVGMIPHNFTIDWKLLAEMAYYIEEKKMQ